MNPMLFQYYDLTQFPLVPTRHHGTPQGYAEAWVCRLMAGLSVDGAAA